MGVEVRAVVRQGTSPQTSSTYLAMAPRRDGGADQRQTILALASGRRRGEILDLLVQRRRDAGAAARLMRKLLKKRGFAPALLVTDKLRSYGAARTRLRLSVRHEQGLRKK
jgi:hypothetical protein